MTTLTDSLVGSGLADATTLLNWNVWSIVTFVLWITLIWVVLFAVYRFARGR